MRGAWWMVSVLVLGCSTVVTVGDPPDAGQVDASMPVDPPIGGPWVGGEIELDEPVEVRGDAFASEVAAAWDGERHLVAWIEGRRVRAVRLSADGALLDATPITLGTNVAQATAGPERMLAVAGHDGQFVVVWSGVREGERPDLGRREIYFGRVRGSDGLALDPGGLVPGLADGDADHVEPSVAAGTLAGEPAFVIAWTARGRGLRVMVLSRNQTHPWNVLTSATESAPDIVHRGGRFFVVHRENDETGTCVAIRGRALEGERGGEILSIAEGLTDCGAPSIASTGTTDLVVWHEWRGGVAIVAGRRYDAATGAALDAAPLALIDEQWSHREPQVSASANEFVIAANAVGGELRDDIVVRRVREDGARRDTELLRVEPARAPAVASGESSHLVAWNDRAAGLSAAILDDGGLHRGGATWGRPTNQELSPSAAYNGEVLAAVWADTRSHDDPPPDWTTTPTGVYAVRVDPLATTIEDAPAIEIATDPRGVLDPRIAPEAGGFVVVWATKRVDDASTAEIVAARLGNDGAIVEGPTTIASGPRLVQAPSVAVRDDGYLIVWEDALDPARFQILAARVDRSLVASEPFALSSADRSSVRPVATAAGEGFLVAWASCDPSAGGVCFYQVDGDRCRSDILGARIAADGTVLDPGGSPIAAEAHCEMSPAIASREGRTFLAWQDGRNFRSTHYDVYGMPLDPSRELAGQGPARPLVSVPRVDGNLSLDAGPTRFALVWSNFGEVRAQWLDAAGEILGPPEGALVAEDVVEVGVREQDSWHQGLQADARFGVALIDDQRAFVTYGRHEAALAGQRVKARFVLFGPAGPPI
ncbi:MAG: hypothetical protein IT378_25125 [Sandaracinaceae bacterium]|nr:hypothetical protein [Sandaracinaceae bacterium]